MLSRMTRCQGASCCVEVPIDKRLDSHRGPRSELALHSGRDRARRIERSSEAMVPERFPDRRGQGSGADGREHGVVELAERHPVSDPVGDIGGACPDARHHPVRVDGGDVHDVHDAPSLDSAGGLVDAGVGSVDEPLGESRSVERRVEDDHDEFGERIGSVLGRDRPAEAGAEQW